MKSLKLPSLAVSLLVSGVFLLTLQSASSARHRAMLTPSAAQPQDAPKIFNAKLKGSKIIITGENFTNDTIVLINGEAVKTVVDSDNPTSVLVAKKFNKVTPMGVEVMLAAQNAAKQTSEPVAFFVGQTITYDDSGKTFTLSVGEKVLLLLKRENYSWTPSVQDPTLLQKIEETALMQNTQGIYQAQRVGTTVLNAVGDLPCSKLTPPCGAPSILFSVNIVVQ
jgi:hypothetical protein